MERHYVFAIVAPIFWSLAGVIVKSLEQATEWQINFYRCGSLAIFVAVVTLLRYRHSTLVVIRSGGLKALLAGALLSGAMICYIVALKYTTVAVAVLVMAAAPIFAALLGRVFLSEAVGIRGWSRDYGGRKTPVRRHLRSGSRYSWYYVFWCLYR